MFCIFILLVLSGTKIAKHGQYDDYLSPKDTNALRGILAIAIVLHHLAINTNPDIFAPVTYRIGYLAVTIFFFLSGYGLMTQYLNRSDYLQGFVKKRISYLMVILILDTALYALIDIYVLRETTFEQIVKSSAEGSMTASSSWYLYVQILFYFFFWAVFSIHKLTIRTKIIMVFFLQAALVPLFVWRSFDSIWYISNFGFTFGLVWAYKKESIDVLLEGRYFLCLGTAVAIFIAFSGLPIIYEHFFEESETVRFLCRMISTVAFAVTVTVLLRKLKPGGWLWDRLGNISMEIYFLHGLIYNFLRSGIVYIENEIVWAILTILITTAVAIPIHVMNTRLSKALKK